MLTSTLQFAFSSAAKEEIVAAVKSIPPDTEIQNVLLDDLSRFRYFQEEIEGLRAELESGNRMAVIDAVDDLGRPLAVRDRRLVNWLIASALGEPLPQNDIGDRVICVYDRDRANTMAKGARYHQTHEGGTIHTDNVNLPISWEYLVMACIHPASTGGETILVNGLQVHEILSLRHPEVLRTLECPFHWEQRGVADATYEAPVITYNDRGEPLFRHLRPYMESAHRKKGVSLTSEQVYALDTLDAILEYSGTQHRLTLQSGQILVTYDSQVLHGRTSFADPPSAVSIIEAGRTPDRPIKRTMDRIWAKRRNSLSASK